MTSSPTTPTHCPPGSQNRSGVSSPLAVSSTLGRVRRRGVDELILFIPLLNQKGLIKYAQDPGSQQAFRAEKQGPERDATCTSSLGLQRRPRWAVSPSPPHRPAAPAWATWPQPRVVIGGRVEGSGWLLVGDWVWKRGRGKRLVGLQGEDVNWWWISGGRVGRQASGPAWCQHSLFCVLTFMSLWTIPLWWQWFTLSRICCMHWLWRRETRPEEAKRREHTSEEKKKTHTKKENWRKQERPTKRCYQK